MKNFILSIVGFLVIFATGCGVQSAIDTLSRMNNQDNKQETSTIITAQSNTMPADDSIVVSGSGPDLFYQYNLVDKDEDITVKGSIKMYFSFTKGSRMETTMEMPMMGTMRLLFLKNNKDSNRVIMANENRKKYKIVILSDKPHKNKEHFSVTRLGEETVHGFHCTHVKADSRKEHYDIWTSKSVPGYAHIGKAMTNSGRMVSDNLWQALKQAGCEGVFVKLVEKGKKQETSTMDLVKAQHTTVTKSMLQIPAGYTKSKGMGFGGIF